MSGQRGGPDGTRRPERKDPTIDRQDDTPVVAFKDGVLPVPVNDFSPYPPDDARTWKVPADYNHRLDTYTALPILRFTFKTFPVAYEHLKQRLAVAAADPRYAGRQSVAGLNLHERDLGRLDPRMPNEFLFLIAAFMDELDALARVFNVPKLRGIKYTGDTKVQASMLGGVMKLNSHRLEVPWFDLCDRTPDRPSAFIPDFTSTNDKRRRFVMDGNGQPVTDLGRAVKLPGYADRYFDTMGERLRNTLFHEFAHHVHQSLDRTTQEWLKSRIEAIKDKYHPSLYSETEGDAEWFAENFSLYFSGCQYLVDPQFTDLIEELIDHAYKI